MKDNGAMSFTEGSEPTLTKEQAIAAMKKDWSIVEGSEPIKLTEKIEIKNELIQWYMTRVVELENQLKEERNKAIDRAINVVAHAINKGVTGEDILTVLVKSLKSDSKMNTEHGYTKGSFYWIKIKQYDDGGQHAIRIADKWSVAQWDGECFEEMNEMYRIESVVEVGPVIPLPDQLKQRDETIKQLKGALKEMLEIADDYTEFWMIKEHHHYPQYMDEHDRIRAIKNKASKLIED